MLVSGAIGANLGRRWGADPKYIWSVLAHGQGAPFFWAVSAWLYYLAPGLVILPCRSSAPG
jgi:hypothetical protein